MTPRNEARSQLESAPWNEYCEAGRERAMQLGNRGPMRFDENGRLAQDILDAYYRTGFYVFTGVVSADEVSELTADFNQVLENAPVSVDGDVDCHGRSAKFAGYFLQTTDDPDTPAEIHLVSHPLMMMDSAMCVYAHPQILKMVESVNGPDFVPFHEGVFHKAAGKGKPTPWHQDGRSHWTEDGESLEKSDGSGASHGFNLSVCLSDATPESCLWVVPGSQRRWRLANDGEFPRVAERLSDAVPMMLAPGDCGMLNRSVLHGSFPNQSSVPRITLLLGYHRRASAIGTKTTNVHAFKLADGKSSKPVEYTEDYVLRRTRMIPLAIDARRQRYPDEVPYVYKGSYVGEGVWSERTRAEISREGDEYWQRDITL